MADTQNNSTEQIQKMQARFRSGAFFELVKKIRSLRNDLDSAVDLFRSKVVDNNIQDIIEKDIKPERNNVTNIVNKPDNSNIPSKNNAQNRIRTRQFDSNNKKQFNQDNRQNNRFVSNKMGVTGQKQKPGLDSKGVVPILEISPTKKSSARKKDNNKVYDDKKVMNKKALVMRGFVEEDNYDEDKSVTLRRSKNKKETNTIVAPAIDHAVITKENLTVKELAEKIGKPVSEIMSKFLILGIMVNINSTIDFASAELIANELGVTLEQKIEKTYEEKLVDLYESDTKEDLVTRPPVVTVMGHVDHGKTSLLDRIRETNVISGEAGGITQHIGAYSITINGQKITFIDTPGHAAFSAMRARGARVTDVAILVVAADDGVMPQTVEAIKHIKDAKVPMIVAINKIDRPDANIQKIKSDLLEYDVVSSEWGGDVIMVPISAKTGEGINELLEMILFVAEYQNLKANPKANAHGVVIEALVDKGKGPVATVIVQNGTLYKGDNIIAGTSTGKIRAMINDKGKEVKEAGPSMAVKILGLSVVPKAGDNFYVVDEKMSKKVANERRNIEKLQKIKTVDLSVDALMDRMKETDYKVYNVIVKGDVIGSVEALKEALSQVENEEVKVKCIHGGVGAVNENDISMAQAANALIVAFNVKVDFKAKVIAEKYKVEIKLSKIIYDVLDYVNKKINSMLTPKYKEVVCGHAEIRVIFKASKIGSIAGSYVLDGKILRNAKARVMRKNKEIYNGQIASLQREKVDAKEVSSGFECGIVLQSFNDIAEGDIIEAYILERIN